ncbi:MAG: DUF4097 family beta strand repeat-containing protein [Gemmatimonadaceae bacterium]
MIKGHWLPALGTAMLGAVMLIATPLAAQRDRERDRDRDEEYRSRIDTTVALDRGGTVDLSLVAGEIRVTGWNRDQVRVNATSERGILRFDATRSRVSLEVRSERGRGGDTRYEVSVPAGTRVLMRSVSGELSATGVNGEIEAHTVSGDIDIADATNRAEFESVSGEVTVARVRGDLRGNAVSGSITVQSVTGEVDVETVSGEVSLTGLQSRFVRAASVSGEVEFDGTIDPAGRYEFNSHSGEVRLVLQGDVNATVSVETFSGSIDSAFPMTLEPGAIGGQHKRFQFRIGNGGARISAESFSGGIDIERGSSRGTQER